MWKEEQGCYDGGSTVIWGSRAEAQGMEMPSSDCRVLCRPLLVYSE